MNWLKYALLGDDREWTYDDYREYGQTPEGRDSYMSIGHDTSNVVLWAMDDKLNLKELTPEEIKSLPLDKRHHGTLIPFQDKARVTGRVDLDAMQGSINLPGDYLEIPSVMEQMRVFDILVNKYPGVKFFVFNGPSTRKVPLQKYVESIDG